MIRIKKLALPLLILIVTVIAWLVIKNNPPQSKRGSKPPSAQMSVEVLKLVPRDYQVVIESFGIVKPRTQSVLVAQVAGQIDTINSQFRDGGFFEQGDELLRIDSRDHQAEVKIAQSALMTAKQSLLEEQARGQQALEDWQRLGNDTVANDLVLRKPHLKAARAKVMSAQAQLEKARLNVERTRIVAPYAGRVLKKLVDVGQVINNNSQLAQIYAVDFVEVRLPIKNNDLALITLPEEFRHGGGQGTTLPVQFRSDLIGEQYFSGQAVRTEGAIDNDAQQLYIVAQIADPYQSNQRAPIKIGQYVTAQIQGKRLNDAMVVPNSAIYQGSYVYVVEQGVLLRKEVSIRWQNATDAIIDKGLAFDQQLVLTSLGQVSSGTRVSVQGQEPAQRQARKHRGDKS